MSKNEKNAVIAIVTYGIAFLLIFFVNKDKLKKAPEVKHGTTQGR